MTVPRTRGWHLRSWIMRTIWIPTLMMTTSLLLLMLLPCESVEGPLELLKTETQITMCVGLPQNRLQLLAGGTSKRLRLRQLMTQLQLKRKASRPCLKRVCGSRNSSKMGGGLAITRARIRKRKSTHQGRPAC